jgi:hypothetical protein
MVIIMTHRLKAVLDERDFLEIWIPAFDTEPFPELESGLYRLFSCAKLKGAKRAFDSIMIDGFAKAYPDIIAEVKHKEPAIEQENYDVPELGLYRVQLSRILEEIYCRFVAKTDLPKRQVEALAA